MTRKRRPDKPWISLAWGPIVAIVHLWGLDGPIADENPKYQSSFPRSFPDFDDRF